MIRLKVRGEVAVGEKYIGVGGEYPQALTRLVPVLCRRPSEII